MAWSYVVLCLISLLPVFLCRPDHRHHHPHQNLDPKHPDLSPETLPGTCLYGKQTYRAGKKFQPDPCTRCTCPGPHGGRARCTIEDCRAVPNCLKWKEKVDGEEEKCCPTCLEVGCVHSDGKVYRYHNSLFRFVLKSEESLRNRSVNKAEKRTSESLCNSLDL